MKGKLIKDVRWIICFLVIMCCGCREEKLLDSLDQRESLEVLVVLNRAGIAVERTQGAGRSRDTYSVSVAPRDYLRAAEILHVYGLPRDSTTDLELLTRQKGFIPNSKELVQMRLSLARSAQVEHLLRALPGVLDARVAIHSAGESAALDDGEKSKVGASVVIRYVSASGKVPFSTDEVKQIVLNSVSDIKASQVLISKARALFTSGKSIFGARDDRDGGVVALTTLSPFAFQVPSSQKEDAQNRLAFVVIIAMLSAGIVGVYLGKMIARSKERNPNSNARELGSGMEDLFIESSIESSSEVDISS